MTNNNTATDYRPGHRVIIATRNGDIPAVVVRTTPTQIVVNEGHAARDRKFYRKNATEVGYTSRAGWHTPATIRPL